MGSSLSTLRKTGLAYEGKLDLIPTASFVRLSSLVIPTIEAIPALPSAPGICKNVQQKQLIKSCRQIYKFQTYLDTINNRIIKLSNVADDSFNFRGGNIFSFPPEIKKYNSSPQNVKKSIF